MATVAKNQVTEVKTSTSWLHLQRRKPAVSLSAVENRERRTEQRTVTCDPVRHSPQGRLSFRDCCSMEYETWECKVSVS